MEFLQTPPTLSNQFTSDRVLQSYLRRQLSTELMHQVRAPLQELGELAGHELYCTQLEDRLNEPKLTQWDAWGKRVDQVEVTRLWKRAADLTATYGLVSIPYEHTWGAYSRMVQFSMLYLFHPSTDFYCCPLAMTDGAAKTLVHHRAETLIQRALPRLTSRDPNLRWTSGQWMTERTGGSDVSTTETIAKPGLNGQFHLYGTKWFTSAVTSQMALTLARPEGNPTGSRGLALFYLEIEDEQGNRNGITVNRLKEKLGTRKVPTAELSLDGTIAVPVVGLHDGIRNITPMLNITRTYNAVLSVASMRRAIALARDYGTKRVQFGEKLIDKPLFQNTLARIQAEYEASFHLAFRLTELLGKEETSSLDSNETILLRALTPIAKLLTGKMVVDVTSEAVECFGGAGYVEDTGIPLLLRDAQVFPIWEGATDVLSLDLLRVLAKPNAFSILEEEVRAQFATIQRSEFDSCSNQCRRTLSAIRTWFQEHASREPKIAELGARAVAINLGKALALAYLANHANWSIDNENDTRPLHAALRFSIFEPMILPTTYVMSNFEFAL